MSITRHIFSGRDLVPNEWFRRGNCPLKKLQRFGLIFRMTWRLKHLYMERCVFPTPAVALLSNHWHPAEMLTWGRVRIRAAGSIILWKKTDRRRISPWWRKMGERRAFYIFNSKDLCMIERVPDLVQAGIDSFKIEGRMKTALYVADVARTYRQAIDDYF